MDKESVERVSGDMARLWASQELGELRKENKRLKDERDGARADVEELKRQVEELKRSVENTGGQLPVGSRALCIGATEREERGASPGPTEVALVRPSSDGIVITQNLPGTVLQFTLTL
jgi:predicted RNase H-like nuclease (RuvC/YqgF family)